MSSYGLALISEFHKEANGASLGCEFLSPGMVVQETGSKVLLGTYWFDTEQDRDACVCYADMLSEAMLRLVSIDGARMTRGFGD